MNRCAGYGVTHTAKYVFTHVKHNDEPWKVITRLALAQKSYTRECDVMFHAPTQLHT